jgi:hypothetical protein
MIYLAVSRVISAFCSLLGVKSMDKEKKSGPQEGAEQIGDIQPQKPRKGKKDKAPIVEEKRTGAKAAPRAEPRKSVGSRESVPTVGEAKGEHQGRTGARESGDRGGAKSLQGGGNSQGGGEGEKEGPFPIFDNPKKIAFLQAYIEMGGHVSKAARAARVDRSTPYNWLAADPAYKEAFERAREQAADVLEAEVIRRGAHGFDEPVFYQGKVVGQIRKYSDNLLMFMLKGLRPAKFRDNYNPLAVVGGDIKISLSIPRPDEPGEIVDAEAREIPEK